MRSVLGWDRVHTPAALWAAWRAFCRGKRRRTDVAAFSVDADRHIHALSRALVAGRWRPSGYRLLAITDPKRRLISAAAVADRVVHTAVYRALAPALDRRFIEHSYACIAGRGAQRAILAFQRRAQQNRFALQLDIRRYFYSVEHERLIALMDRVLPEPEVRGLVRQIVYSARGLYARPKVAEWLGWERPLPADRGLPIGNLTSQWWGNHYLDALDHFVQRELRPRGYQRYMDDITLFDGDPARLLAARDAIAGWLSSERGLVLKEPDCAPRSCLRPLLYLGVVVTRESLRLGPKARGRISTRVARAIGSPRRLERAIGGIAGTWMWGSRARGVSA